MAKAIGIDLGTTNSVVGFAKSSGPPGAEAEHEVVDAEYTRK